MTDGKTSHPKKSEVFKICRQGIRFLYSVLLTNAESVSIRPKDMKMTGMRCKMNGVKLLYVSSVTRCNFLQFKLLFLNSYSYLRHFFPHTLNLDSS